MRDETEKHREPRLSRAWGIAEQPGAKRDHAMLTAAGRTTLMVDGARWLLVAASLLWTFISGPLLGLPTANVLFLLALPFFLIHGLRHYGFRAVVTFAVATFVISNLYENCSILTGFPFGRYYYTGEPKLFLVPLSIGPFYIAIGYLSWQTANVLLGMADMKLDRSLNLVLLPALAAAIMTMFDLTADPGASTVRHAWIWEDGGGYFGVPLTNFTGWWLCTYTFFQVFALTLWRSRDVQPASKPRQFSLQPVILYFNLGLVTVVRFATSAGGGETVAAANGAVWRIDDINEATMTVFLFTMGVMTVLATTRLYGTQTTINE